MRRRGERRRGEEWRKEEKRREAERKRERRREEVPTNEMYFGILRAEGLHGSYLALTEGGDLLNFTAEPVL